MRQAIDGAANQVALTDVALAGAAFRDFIESNGLIVTAFAEHYAPTAEGSRSPRRELAATGAMGPAHLDATASTGQCTIEADLVITGPAAAEMH